MALLLPLAVDESRPYRFTVRMPASGYRVPAATPTGAISSMRRRSSARERDVERRDVLLEVLHPLRARDRDDVVALRQHPRERELRRGAAFLPRDLLHERHEVEVLLEVLALEARVVAAVVVGREIVDRAELPGQEAAAERAVGDEADAELAARSAGSRPRRRGSRANTRSAAPRSDGRRTRGGSSPAPPRCSPRCRTLPAVTSSAIAPTVSSIGTSGSTRCW